MTISLNLKDAIDDEVDLLRASSKEPSTKIAHHSILSRLYHLQFICRPEKSDLAAAISHLKRCIRSSALDSFHKAMFQAEMGLYYHSCFHSLSTQPEDDLKSSVDCLRLAIKMVPPESPPAQLVYLYCEFGSLLTCQFRYIPDTGLLDEAVNCVKRSVELAVHDDKARSTCLDSLIDMLASRFDILHKAQDLDEAINYQEQSMALSKGIRFNFNDGLELVFSKQKTPGTLDSLVTYCSLLSKRFEHSGRVEDLDTATRFAEFVVAEAADHPNTAWPQRTKWIRCLANCLMQRFRACARMEDINRVIDLVAYNWEPECLYDVGKLLVTAFEWFHRKEYLDIAVHYLKLAVARSNIHHKALAYFQSSFRKHMDIHDINAVKQIFDHDPEFLENVLNGGVGLVGAALRHNDDWSQRAERMSDLGCALAMRFEYSERHEDSDIQKAIDCQSRALAMSPATSHVHHRCLMSLGSSHRARFEFQQNRSDIDKAIELQLKALAKLPAPDPYRISALSSLGQSFLQLSKSSSNEQHFQEGMDYLHEAVVPSYGFTHDRIRASLRWATLLHNRNGYPIKDNTELLRRALEGYEHTILLLARAAWIGLNSSSHLAQLYSTPRSLAGDAAACAFQIAEADPEHREMYIEKAVELLDLGQTIFSSQATQLRADLELLYHHKPLLAAELDAVSQKLLRPDLKDTDIKDVGRIMQELANQWDKLVEQVRELPDFCDFLLPIPFSKLRKAAETRPIVIVNVSKHRCDALVIPSEGNLTLLPLPCLSQSQVKSLATDLTDVFRDGSRQEECGTLLNEMWHAIGEPVVEKLKDLGLVESVSVSNSPDVRWCLTDYLGNILSSFSSSSYQGQSMLDWLVPSYTPNLSILLRTGESQVSYEICHGLSEFNPVEDALSALTISSRKGSDVLQLTKNQSEPVALSAVSTPGPSISPVPWESEKVYFSSNRISTRVNLAQASEVTDPGHVYSSEENAAISAKLDSRYQQVAEAESGIPGMRMFLVFSGYQLMFLEVPDLTSVITKLTDFPVGCGGYADIFMGEWIKTRRTKKKVAIKVMRRHAIDLLDVKVCDRVNKVCP